MTFYIRTHPYTHAQQRPYRRVYRQGVGDDQPGISVNVHEQEDAFVLSAPVPGLTADDLHIQVLEDVIRIEGEYKEDDHAYLVRELPHGSFTRTLRLPAAIAADRIEAQIAEGMLTLTLPKAEAARAKKIKITSR